LKGGPPKQPLAVGRRKFLEREVSRKKVHVTTKKDIKKRLNDHDVNLHEEWRTVEFQRREGRGNEKTNQNKGGTERASVLELL